MSVPHVKIKSRQTLAKLRQEGYVVVSSPTGRGQTPRLLVRAKSGRNITVEFTVGGDEGINRPKADHRIRIAHKAGSISLVMLDSVPSLADLGPDDHELREEVLAGVRSLHDYYNQVDGETASLHAAAGRKPTREVGVRVCYPDEFESVLDRLLLTEGGRADADLEEVRGPSDVSGAGGRPGPRPGS